MSSGILTRLANPAAFRAFARPALPAAAAVAVLCLGAGSYLALLASPPDHRQLESVRILYVHVPAAWLSLQTYAIMAAASLFGFVWRHRVADLAARACGPIGLAFTFLTLVTGSLYGKVTWGVFWDWDPRLVSTLVLLFLYMGYIAIWEAFEDEAAAARTAALFALLGAVNLPIVKFSVDWWDSLHQRASVFRSGGPSMPPEMLAPLFLMAAGYTAITALYILLRVRAALGRRASRPKTSRPSVATMEPAE